MRRLLTFFALGLAVVSTYSCGTSSSLPVNEEDEQINAGYWTVDKKNNTNAISSVKADNTALTYRNTTDYLLGRVAGLNMTSDGRLNIRGAKNSSGQYISPLVIIDGVKTFDVNAIAPNDIYSVDVIKDASASMYGIEGEGGVIIITSKGAHFTQEQGNKQTKKEKKK